MKKVTHVVIYRDTSPFSLTQGIKYFDRKTAKEGLDEFLRSLPLGAFRVFKVDSEWKYDFVRID